ncbi:hypothetical protein TNCV_4523011 [Trichonephila clavipes]|nr:hypothetical protein TNCV_4523011 [Trichonephila clavipes]
MESFMLIFRCHKQTVFPFVEKQGMLFTPYTWEQSCVETGGGIELSGSDVVQSGRPIFDDFFQHLWPYIGNNTANVVFQMVKRLWLIRIDQ